MATERSTFVVLPSPTQPGRWRWLAPDAETLAEGELAELQRSFAILSPRPALALLWPAETVLTTTVVVPSRKPQHIHAAVPNLVEEWLADELEGLHIAVGERDAQGQVAVAAIAKSLLREWLNALEAAGLTPDTAAIDALRLPWQPGEIALAVDGARALLRWGEHHGGAIDSGQLGLWLNLLLAQWPSPTDRPRTLALLSADAAQEHGGALADTIEQLRQRHHLALRQQMVASDLTVWLCRNRQAAPLELLQGEFAPRADHALLWRRWRPVAYAAGVVVALQLSFNIGMGLWLNHRAEQWRDQSTALYRELFPADRRLVNLRQQLQNHLDQADTSTASPFLALFGQLAGAIQARGESTLQLRSLTFEAGTGQLVVELAAPSVASMDALQKHLQGQGVNATILSAINENQRVVGRLRLGRNRS